jgi:hypothetical protein
MGNLFSNSSSSSSSTTNTEALSAYDMKIYEDRREKIFYGSIAVIIFYAAIALLMLLSSYYFESIRFILFNRFLAFTVVFIVGTVLIALILAHQVYNFNPIKINKRYTYDNLSCPDYWNLKLMYDDSDSAQVASYSNLFSSNININLFKYSCEMNSNIFDSNDIYKANFITSHTGNDPSTTDHFIYTTGTSLGGSATLNNANLVDANSANLASTNRFIFANINDTKSDSYLKNIINRDSSTDDFKAFKAGLLHASYIMNNYEYDRGSSTDPLGGGSYYNLLNLPTDWNSNNKARIQNAKTELNTNDKYTLEYNIKAKDGNAATSENITTTTDAITKRNLLDNNLIKNTTVVKTTPLICNRLYPSYMAAIDNTLSSGTNGNVDSNVFRCAYSKLCKVPWSEMNCDKYPDA